ncbi:hypothetical protein XO10_09015 [Marinitoga sp. 1135]|uniref:DUF2194 domain-containing protein n=1 Tax=unclassified Marinitoga TaxID=2640159 RepID=UPI001586AC88|nr:MULTISPECIES: DUF2194 domain-containing protein [unclassified Marinitoga]NUU96395.1 hypothetical protein [Marinitoga sp. 1135]NUU98317.1 hypothetical protein [Marinitoga sp. 1138]
MKKKILLLILIIIAVLSFSQKELLLLYKQSENYGEMMFKYHIIPILEKNNIRYELKNVEEMNYYKITNEKYFGVITWYYSSEMAKPELYLRQLATFVENGGIYFFFNNIGASADISEMNNLLNKIGVQYKYGYRELEDYTIECISDYFLKKPDSEYKVPVEKYITFDNHMENILTYKIDNEEYPMIFLTDNGGAAIFNSFVDKNGNLIININKLIHRFINHEVGTLNKFLIVNTKYDNQKYLDSQYEIKKILLYAKQNFDVISVEQFYKLSFFDLIPYKYIIWNTDAKYVETRTIKKFINSGGTFIYSTQLFNTPWSSYVKEDNININKISFTKDLFPLTNTATESYINMYFELNYHIDLPGNIKPLAFFCGDGKSVPVIWYQKEGKGYRSYINPDVYLKNIRGLIFQSIMSMQKNSISGFLNSFMFYIDDFPLPSYNVVRAKINGKDITDDEYYYTIWWPSIKKFSKEFNIKYTFVTPLSYNGSSNPPFEFSEFLMSNTNSPLKALREIDKSEFELGLHGYNHNSLTKDRWPNPNNILLSLRAAKTFIEKILGHPIELSSYVAPNNIIDEFGANQLLKAIPEIKTIGTSYEAKDEFSEYKIINNFTLVIPRSTYGYYPLKRIYIATINTLANFGAFQHFIHPDDLFDKGRNPENKTWMEMYSSLRTFYLTIKKKFPWLRNHTASEAYQIYFDYLTQNVKYKWNGNNLTVVIPDSSIFPKYFYVKSQSGIDDIINGKIIDYYPESKLYVIEMDDNIMNIKFSGDDSYYEGQNKKGNNR